MALSSNEETPDRRVMTQADCPTQVLYAWAWLGAGNIMTEKANLVSD